jgi:hypothetical protein
MIRAGGPGMLIAQAVVEHGMLDSLAAGLSSAVDQADYYIGPGHAKWLLIGLAVVLAVIFFRPRR